MNHVIKDLYRDWMKFGRVFECVMYRNVAQIYVRERHTNKPVFTEHLNPDTITIGERPNK